MVKARKFKKKLAPKIIRKKAEPVLSVNLIGKENVEKIRKVLGVITHNLSRITYYVSRK
jgi:hypothetical protein